MSNLASVARLLLSPSWDPEYISNLLTDFISSQNNNFDQERSFDSGVSLFYTIQQVANLKLSSNDVKKREKVEWVRIFLKVFMVHGFIGFIMLGGLL